VQDYSGYGARPMLRSTGRLTIVVYGGRPMAAEILTHPSRLDSHKLNSTQCALQRGISPRVQQPNQLNSPTARNRAQKLKGKGLAMNEAKLESPPGKIRRKISAPGSIFQRPDSPFLWISYSRNGRKYRESAHSTAMKVAKDLLKTRMGDSVNKPFDVAALTKVTVANLVAAYLQDYRLQERKSINDAETRWRLHLEPTFGNWRAAQVTTAAIANYREHRKGQDAALASINRELALLKAAYHFGLESDPPTVLRVPKIKLPSEKGNERKGFFEDGAQRMLFEYCGELWFRGAVEIARVFGWRISEVKGLRVRQVDFAHRTITLDSGTTKNGEARVVTMTNDLSLLLQECARGKGAEDFLLTRRNNKPIKDFRTTWKNACEHAGCPGRLFHDLRRTAAKNLIDAGISEGVVMAIGGWKTRSVFDRYHIKTQKAIETDVPPFVVPIPM
jgi:integrase